MCARIQQLEADVLASVFSAGLRKGKENVVVDELRELLRTLGARGSAVNEEAVRAMRYGTTARNALDEFLKLRGFVDETGDPI